MTIDKPKATAASPPLMSLGKVLRQPDNKAARCLILFLFTAAVFLREPGYFLAPQFWIEEGLVYYAHAWNDSAGAAFTLLFAGYWSCFENLWALLSVWLVPMEHAALSFKLGGLLVMLTAPVVILHSRASHWQWPWAKTLGCLIVLITPLSDELWVSPLGAKFFFSLTFALLLLEPVNELSSRRRFFIWTLLIIGALTSPVPCMLTPFFALKWCLDRSPENARRACWMSAALLFHLVIMRLPSAGLADRQIEPDLVATVLVWLHKCVLLPLFGSRLAHLSGVQWLLPAVEQHAAWLPALALAVLVLPVVLVALVWRQTRDPKLLLVLLASFTLGFASLWSAVGEKHLMLHPTWAPRYSLTPGILLVLVLLQLALNPQIRSKAVRIAARSLVMVSLLSGLWEFRHARFYMSGQTVWTEECRQWRADPDHELRIWPPPHKFKLQPRE